MLKEKPPGRPRDYRLIVKAFNGLANFGLVVVANFG